MNEERNNFIFINKSAIIDQITDEQDERIDFLIETFTEINALFENYKDYKDIKLVETTNKDLEKLKNFLKKDDLTIEMLNKKFSNYYYILRNTIISIESELYNQVTLGLQKNYKENSFSYSCFDGGDPIKNFEFSELIESEYNKLTAKQRAQKHISQISVEFLLENKNIFLKSLEKIKVMQIELGKLNNKMVYLKDVSDIYLSNFIIDGKKVKLLGSYINY